MGFSFRFSNLNNLTVDEKIRRGESISISMLNLLLGIALVAMIIYPFHSSSLDGVLACYGTTLIVALAALLTGGVVGFIFGIPRQLRRGDRFNSPYSANTNLEQVSDWLTKILVGAGLTQIGIVPTLVQDLGRHVSLSSGNAVCPVIASSVAVFFLAFGFLYGYLWTSLNYFKEITAAGESTLIRVEKVQLDEAKKVIPTEMIINATNLEKSLDDIAKLYEKNDEGGGPGPTSGTGGPDSNGANDNSQSS